MPSILKIIHIAVALQKIINTAIETSTTNTSINFFKGKKTGRNFEGIIIVLEWVPQMGVEVPKVGLT
jgi:hypothetical protein